PEQWQEILLANNARAPMWLRVNRQKTTTTDYLKLLDSAEPRDVPGEARPDIHAEALLEGFDQAIRLSAPRAVTDLPGFDDGFVSVQDAAAQLAAPFLLGKGLSGTGRILDACAAPGGKAAHLLELCTPGTSLTAVDAD